MTPDPITHLCAVLRGEPIDLARQERRRLLATAKAHRVDRLLAWRTGEITDDIRAAAILDEVDVRELNRVLTALEMHGVVPLVVKGAALAHTHYEASWLRPRVDADLLIDRSHRPLIAGILRDLGYTQPAFISGELVMYQMPFARAHATGEMHLDVHWRIVNPQLFADLPAYDELAARAATIDVRGQSMRTPRAVDALLLACVHRAAHHDLSDDLIWLYDIHLVAERFTAEEWTDFIALAATHRVRALCADALRTARDCFHTALPPDVTSQDGAHVERTERSTVYLRKDLTRLDRLMLDLRALKPRARLRLLTEHMIPPARYISQKYDARSGLLLPLFYLRRLAAGLPRLSRRG